MAECGQPPEIQERLSQPHGLEENDRSRQGEADGRWMRELRKCVQMTVKKCLSGAHYRLFAESFKTLHKKCPGALKSIHRQFLEQLETSMNEEISKLYEEENLSSLMNQLEEMTGQTDQNIKAWRPTRNVADDIRAHTQPLKVKQVERLEKIAQKLEQENKQLREAVEARRKKFLDTEKTIQDYVTKLEQACVACQELPLNEMEAELNEMGDSAEAIH